MYRILEEKKTMRGGQLTFTMDLQSDQLSSMLKASALYYKICVYNFTINNIAIQILLVVRGKNGLVALKLFLHHTTVHVLLEKIAFVFTHFVAQRRYYKISLTAISLGMKFVIYQNKEIGEVTEFLWKNGVWFYFRSNQHYTKLNF